MKILSLLTMLALSTTAALAATKPVPASCTAEVNAPLLAFLHNSGANAQLDNVMVCGTAVIDSFEQPASNTGTGAHQVTVLSIPTSDGSTVLVEIVSNDSLDGIVQAKAKDTVYAYGQAYITTASDNRMGYHPAVGVHDTHCATNSHMDDGWVVVNQTHYPTRPCTNTPHHHHSY